MTLTKARFSCAPPDACDFEWVATGYRSGKRLGLLALRRDVLRIRVLTGDMSPDQPIT